MEAADNEQYFFNFSFFKIDPKWRWMADLAKEESAKEVENIIINSGIRFRTYSTLGLRDDAEFLFWFAAETVEEIQDVISKLYLTVFGKYIIPSRVYLSCTRSSTYARKGTLPSFVLGNEPQKICSCISIYQDKRMVSLTTRTKAEDDGSTHQCK